MAGQKTLVFWRDDDDGPACIEYSWVPEGKRRVILLSAQQDEGSRTDPVLDNVSHVQLYRLASTGRGADSWQFPPGTPRSSPVIYATVEVFHSRGELVGTVHYADGVSRTDTFPLKTSALPCPEL